MISHPLIASALAAERERALRERARDRAGGRRDRGAIRIRTARTGRDAADVERLAQLDSTRAPLGTILIADLDGTPSAAMSVDDGRVVADPFRPTADAVAVLRARAVQVREAETGSRLLRRLAFGTR